MTLSSMLLALGFSLATGSAYALTADEAIKLASGDTDTRIAALAEVIKNADEKTFALIKAMNEDSAKLAGGRVLIVQDNQVIDAVSGVATTLPNDAEDVISIIR